MSCGVNANLDEIKGKTEELNSLLQGGKDQLSAMQGKLGELQSELSAFKPEIPEVPSLQKDLLGLASEADPLGLATKISEIKGKYGDAVPDLSGKLSSLGLDSFPPSIDTSAICDQIPNVEIKSDGTTKEEPSEPKPAEEVPPEPTPEKKTAPVPPVEKDPYELNKVFLLEAGKQWRKFVRRRANAAEGLPVFGSGKISTKLFLYSRIEVNALLFENGGLSFDDAKIGITLAQLREKQTQLLAKYPKVVWDFTEFNPKFEEFFNNIKDANDPEGITDFKTACAENADRRKKKLETQSAE